MIFQYFVGGTHWYRLANDSALRPAKIVVNFVNEILIAYHLSVPPATTAPLCRPDTVVPLS